MKIYNILNFKVNNIQKTKFINLVFKHIESKEILNVAIANAHTVNTFNTTEVYNKVLNDFFIINDGIGLDIASKLLYKSSFYDNLNGTDLIPEIFVSSDKNLRVYLYGAKDEVLESCKANIEKNYKNIQIVGHKNGYLPSTEYEQLINEINLSNADILLVAKGNPLQELWIHQYSDFINTPVRIGVGALFDFLSGNTQRAPLLVRNLKLEWLYRLIIEPRRMWKRYLIGNFSFLFNVIRQKIGIYKNSWEKKND